MLKKAIPYLIVLFFAVSCYEFKKPEKPKDLIPKSEMVKILIDLKLLSSINGQDPKVLDTSNIDVDNYIYRKYNIDSTQFESSSDYYAYHLDDYVDIYDKVKDSLEKLNKYYKDMEGKDPEALQLDKKPKPSTDLNRGMLKPVSDKAPQP